MVKTENHYLPDFIQDGRESRLKGQRSATFTKTSLNIECAPKLET